MIDKLIGWIARDDQSMRSVQSTYLFLYLNKPIRDGNYGWIDPNGIRIPLHNNAYNLEWHQDPVKVEISINELTIS